MKNNKKDHVEETIKKVIDATFEDIVEIYKLQTGKNGNPVSKLRFPYKYISGEPGDLRISEQELRALFIEKLQDTGLYYNVEAPTMADYRFETTEGNRRSGNFDLVICDETGKERSALIEFKGLNPNKKCYAKDYWKLKNSDESEGLRYFLHVVRSASSTTYGKIRDEKLNAIYSYAEPFKVDMDTLTEKVIYRCVCLESQEEITEKILNKDMTDATNNS